MQSILLKSAFRGIYPLLLAGNLVAQNVPAGRAQIAVQPVGVTLRVGDIARFSVEAAGSEPLTYVWLKNGMPIPSSDGPEWAVPVATAADDGARYRCVVANSLGMDSSITVTLHVSTALLAPHIVAQPDSAPVVVGDTAFIGISAKGTDPLSFTWYKDGIAVPGATASVLKLFPISWADNGASVKCRISNAAGVVESRPFGLKVVQPNGKTVVLQGDLRDAQGLILGTDKTETVDVIVRLYRDAKGGAPLYEERFLTGQGQGVAVRQGRFGVALGQTASTGDLSQIVQSAATLFVSFAIAKPGLTPETLEPRTP
ncbi:MAG: hypothetical protein M3Y08_06270, partial [Fibrobacterota bacterium]|nr:hypothetical protein [Fibrobacterota bacterium]